MSQKLSSLSGQLKGFRDGDLRRLDDLSRCLLGMSRNRVGLFRQGVELLARTSLAPSRMQRG